MFQVLFNKSLLFELFTICNVASIPISYHTPLWEYIILLFYQLMEALNVFWHTLLPQ